MEARRVAISFQHTSDSAETSNFNPRTSNYFYLSRWKPKNVRPALWR